MQKKRRINIMTSCDENYAKLVPVQLLSIADNLSDYEVHFYLFHNQMQEKCINSLRICCEKLNIGFQDMKIRDVAPYEELATKGGGWVPEAYFALECHTYLPAEVDRVMYVDAADVLILGDIAEYYFSDFDDHLIIATGARFKRKNNEVHQFEDGDLEDLELANSILRGAFNSGSYVINTEKLRIENVSINDFLKVKSFLESMSPDFEQLYHGDQGILSIAYIGSIKLFGYPQVRDLMYQPYNFCMWFFDLAPKRCNGNPWYVPKVVHFAGAVKPWNLTEDSEKTLKPGQWPFTRYTKCMKSWR
ncbi:MAG: hypothetical protein FWB97_07685 [Oscillospiraceae bacterium]|nr:hypothetical protein [Oscillospiraceae bacterium]